MNNVRWAAFGGVVLACALLAVWGFRPSPPPPQPAGPPSASEGAAPLVERTPIDGKRTSPRLEPPIAPDAPVPAGLSGIVVDAHDNPVSGAIVSAYTANRGATRVTTGLDGRFLFDDLPAGAYRLSAKKDHFNDAVLDAVAHDAPRQRLVLTPLSALSGQVSRAGDGAPVAAFQIATLDVVLPDDAHWRTVMHDARTLWRAFDDPGGAFRIEDVPSDVAFAIAARADGLEPTWIDISPIAPGDTREDVALFLGALTRVEGIVVDEADIPVQGARIYADEDKYDATLAVSGSDGQFLIEELGESTATLFANHPDYPEAAAQVTPVAGQTVQVRLVFESGATLQGLVTRDGEPITGAHIQVMSILAMNNGGKSVTTDDDGQYAIGGLVAGVAIVEARDAGVPEIAEHLHREIELAANGVTVADFEFTGQRASLAGYATVDAIPVQNARIEVVVENPSGTRNGFAITGADGAYTIEDLPPGPFTATFFASVEGSAIGRLNATGELVANAITRQDFSLSTAEFGAIRGRVTNVAEGDLGAVMIVAEGVPVPEPGGDISRLLSLERQSVQQTEIGPGGDFLLESIPPGAYTVVAVTYTPADDADILQTLRTATTATIVKPLEEQELTLTFH